jgi:2-keto-4-pentenoate hydratase
MMEKSTLQDLAQELYQAGVNRVSVPPLSERFPKLTIEDSYRIQLINNARRMDEGRVVVGKKIGLTSMPMQALLGVQEPDYGHLYDDFTFCEEEEIPIDLFIQPKIEPELAFLLREDLRGPGINVARVLEATAGVIPSFEIIDSRIEKWRIKIQDTVADNASSGGFILGRQMFGPGERDWRHVGMVLERRGRVVNCSAGAAVMGHPAAAVAWLANCLSAYDITLEKGELILSGSLVAAIDVEKGDSFCVTFDGLGSVKALFK